MTEGQRSFRKELAQHMWHMHGEFRNTLDLTTEELESVHDMMHRDEYGCPAHSHGESGPYSIGKVKLKFGKRYIEKMVEALRGEF
tara:strand:- start:95 stop:349 length:255 start_codon:yes stop_codon:yes gene_type:complete